MNDNIKARKLKRGDKIVIGGFKYTITMLNLHFGGKRERVSMHMHSKHDADGSFSNMNVPADTVFNVTRKKK